MIKNSLISKVILNDFFNMKRSEVEYQYLSINKLHEDLVIQSFMFKNSNIYLKENNCMSCYNNASIFSCINVLVLVLLIT